MRAFRNVAGNVVEIEVDISLDGQPILPPDTTVDPKPELVDGHYLTVVGREWVQIPVPQQVISFSVKKAEAIARLNQYKNWLQEQDIEFQGMKFQANAQARERVTQALVTHREFNYLPPAWISSDNLPYPLTSIDDFKPLATAVMNAFSTRFFQMDAIRRQILGANDLAELEAIEIPVTPSTI